MNRRKIIMGSDELIEGPILAHDDFLLILCHKQTKIFFGLSMSWHFLALRSGYRCPGIYQLPPIVAQSITLQGRPHLQPHCANGQTFSSACSWA